MSNADVEALLRSCIRDIPDFPKPGILFRDLTPLLANAEALRAAVQTALRNANLFPGSTVNVENAGTANCPLFLYDPMIPQLPTPLP